MRYVAAVRSVLTRASAAIDRGVVRWMERRIAPRRQRAAELDGDPRAQLIEIARAYNAGAERFFAAPEPPTAALSPLGDGPLGTQVVDLQFASAYEPFLPAARDAYLAARENLTAHARWWTSGRGRPTVVMLHGWGAGSHWVTERTFAVAYWLRHGYDVAAFVLPFHGPRGPANGPQFPQFPSPNPLRTNEAFGHAIYDLRALALWLRSRGATAVGALGMSLGGYTTALWASVAGPRDAGGIDFAAALIPAVSFAQLMWRHGEDSPMRRRAVKAGVSEDLLADAFAVHAPTTRPVRLPADRLFVIAGKGDRITPPEQAEALAAHWGVPVRWFEGGHLAQIGKSGALRELRRALGGLDLPGRAFRS